MEISQSEYQNMCNRIAAQKREITNLRKTLQKRNDALDALHHVWCSGGCNDYNLTEELVHQAEVEVSRMRTALVNVRFRERWQADEQFRRDWYREHDIEVSDEPTP